MLQIPLTIALMQGFVACGAGGYFDRLDDEVDIEETLFILPGGQNLVYRLETGNYELQLTGSSSVDINWVGSECGEIPRTQGYTNTCELSGNGQLIITNPSTFASDVTVKITQLLSE